MNRAEATRQVLLLEAAAAQLKDRAKGLRSDMDADARAELDEQGTAPTWRLQGIGTWSLPVTKEAPVVVDTALLLEWVRSRYPSEIVEVINPPFLMALLAKLEPLGEVVIDGITGEIVPGLGVRQGGRPLTVRFKPNGDAEAVADQQAAQLVKEITAGLRIEESPRPHEKGGES